jgi:N-acetylglucosamine-6-phosphate deacetylase
MLTTSRPEWEIVTDAHCPSLNGISYYPIMSITVFTNCRVCEGGRLLHKDLAVSDDRGRIVDGTPTSGHNTVDLGGAIIGPGLIELQTNGMRGFHFTHFEDGQSYAQKIEDVARYLPSTGCTSFYATIPTVSSDDFKKVIIPASAISQIAKCTL